jgi:lipopolysaccharide transport system ATP-binding protein
MSDEVLVAAEHVSKKFCRSLRRSLWYGVKDVGTALNPFSSVPVSDAALSRVPVLRQDEFFAVRDISFELRRGECVGLIGHNGAGKSTLLKILNGLVPPDGGKITIRGRVAALIELNAGFNPILTGRENIYTEAALLGFSREETDSKFDAIVEFAEIGDFLDMPVQNYSSGMRVRLGFAVAAQMEPDVLIIDEVLAVGDVAFRFKCLNRIGELMHSAAVIFVSHTMPQIYRLCDEVIVLDHGSVTYQGKNIAEGVGTYLSLFNSAEATVTGSGEVHVDSLTLRAGSSEASLGETLRTGFGSGLTMEACLSASPGLPARVQFLLWNAEMLPVMDVLADDLAGHEIKFPASGITTVTATLPSTELNAGHYSLSVIVSTPNHDRVYCRHDNAAYIQIDAGTASGAHVLSIARWQVNDTPAMGN